MECSYPDVFNAATMQCDDFENVECGDREEFENACKHSMYIYVVL